MASELLIRAKDDDDLQIFGTWLFDTLGVKSVETRYSDNVADGRYLTGEACGLRIMLEIADYKELSYDFLLSFEPIIWERGSNAPNLSDLADVVARYLARKGLSLARPLNFGRAPYEVIEYGP
jgi:hypothetical protein